MRTEWVKNDWYSTAFIVYCENCGKNIYNGVYTIPMTDSQRDKEEKRVMRGLSKYCPKCGKEA